VALGEPVGGSPDRGIYQWKNSLPAILTDSPSAISHELLRRLVASHGAPSPVYERVELQNRSRLPFDRADAASTQELLLIGSREADDNAVRTRLLPFWNRLAS
jgi:hypothetical protein